VPQEEMESGIKPLCVNCGRSIDASYCSHCGEKVLSDRDYSLRHLMKEGLELLVDFDFKFVKTAALLIRKPGFLTTEYWSGRRIKYTNPFQLLLLINIFYFFCSFVSEQLGYNIRVMFPTLSDLTGDRIFSGWASHVVQTKILAEQIPVKVYYDSFNSHLEQLAKSLVILLVPILALFLRVFYWRSKRYFVEHFISAAHLVSFYVFFWSLLMLFSGSLAKISALLSSNGHSVQFFSIPLLRYSPPIIIGVYIFFALRQMYKQNIVLTIITCLLLIFVVIQAITNIYDFILFWIAYYLV
jgi:Protein of unknown function (DUF3667)